MAGIVRYGSYVPYCRLQRRLLGGGRGERAVASFDEDSTTLAVEACREALPGTPPIDDLILATTSGAYTEKINSAAIQAACSLPGSVRSSEFGATSRAGLGALSSALDLAKAGRCVLIAASDVVTGAPMGSLERDGGDAAVAFVVSDSAESGAELLGSASATTELLDTWRAAGVRFPAHWEERFGRETLAPVVTDVAERALRDAGLQATELTTVVLDAGNPRVFDELKRSLEIKPGTLADSLATSVGRAGAGHAGLLLARALDQAVPGDRILVVSAADGAEALVLEVTQRIDACRPRRSVDAWVASGSSDLEYLTYLKWRELLPFEPPRRPEPDRPSAPPSHRSEKWKFGFVGERCRACGARQLPPQRVCASCGAVDEMDEEHFSRTRSRVRTFSIDHLTYSLNPPVVFGVLDFAAGGRLSCELTDVESSRVSIGMELEMTFRRLYTSQGVHNYFWKARPIR